MTLVKKGVGLFFLTCFFAACSTTSTQVQPREAAPRKVVVISVDGLLPEFYLDGSFNAPTLKSLVKGGAYASAAIPVYPSMTFPNHASIVTGVHPAKHGILSNTIFVPKKGPTREWYWDSKHLKVPAIWDAARAAGKKVAVFAWPVSVGANVDWLVPEIFSAKGIDHGENWKLMLRHTDPKLMAELISASRVKTIRSNLDYDRWTTDASLHVLKTYRPDLLLLHFRTLDDEQHHTGRASKNAKAALTRIDALIGELVAAIDFKDTVLIVTGDHGFENAERTIDIHAVLAKGGWLKQAVAHGNSGQAAIYGDPKLANAIVAHLQEHAEGHYRVITAAQLRELGAFPDALCAIDPAKGYSLGFAGLSAKPRPQPLRGQHGALANPMLSTGLVVYGAGIVPEKNLGQVHTLDVAPTVAEQMRLSFPATDGHSLPISVR
ncbi:MAG TPA: ectonucleotide pyrophosphatase/phosphodiesterase [Bdellovibrionota bacterium]|nr:ectonucleotide pyrophosphatase/phosphodiesterase [Bdellovibrionota bacterium]